MLESIILVDSMLRISTKIVEKVEIFHKNLPHNGEIITELKQIPTVNGITTARRDVLKMIQC